jgi:hypothetical protein
MITGRLLPSHLHPLSCTQAIPYDSCALLLPQKAQLRCLLLWVQQMGMGVGNIILGNIILVTPNQSQRLFQ